MDQTARRRIAEGVRDEEGVRLSKGDKQLTAFCVEFTVYIPLTLFVSSGNC